MPYTSFDRQIAEGSLQIGSIKLRPEEPFLWASGFYMPIYNDNRMNLFYPEKRDRILAAFEEAIRTNQIPYEIVAGTSTAGIPWGALKASRSGSPFIYIRDKAKDHGLQNRIEGIDSDQDLAEKKVILFEDLVSTGGSSVSAVQGIRDARGDIDNTLCIFSYGLDEAMEMFEGKRPYDKKGEATLEKPCRLHSLLTYEVLLDVAIETGYINDKQAEILVEWRTDPFNWGEKHGFAPIKK